MAMPSTRSQPRTQHTPNSSSISSLQTTASVKSHSRGRRPSISNTMVTWLSRSSTSTSSHSAQYIPSKPIRISEPKFTRSLEILNRERIGALGSGATVVRTPEEALSGSRVRVTYQDAPTLEEVESPTEVEAELEEVEEEESDDLPSPPSSPPLPPLPQTPADFQMFEPEAPKPPRPTRTPPPPPTPSPSVSFRPSLKSSSTPCLDYFPAVPALPTNIPATPLAPEFRPILISEVPSSDPTKIIISLETSTAVHRTTFDTIMSRPSHLSAYISSLFPRSRRNSDASSVYSNTSEDVHTYRHHLTTQGLLPQSSFTLHIFLDRPSAPYAHILTYLRSPEASPSAPEQLPRAVQLHFTSQSRLDTLLELRDEAQYLQLDALYKLCTDEIRLRHAPRVHTRGYSSGSGSGSVHSMHASVCSLHALAEQPELQYQSQSHRGPADRDSVDTKGSGSSNEAGYKSPATPQSWNGRARSQSRQDSVRLRSPPAGWI